MSNTPTVLTVEDLAILARNWERQRRAAERAGTLHRGVMCPDNDYADSRIMFVLTAARFRAQEDAAEHAEWCEASDAMRRAEGAWEDNGCQPVRDL
jgi:hypothetical protein